jgi:outer membrane lipoprotein LolB
MRLGVCFVLMLWLQGCSYLQTAEIEGFRLDGREVLQQDRDWSFEGRVGLSNEKESLSLSLLWNHQKAEDRLELTGPLAQGRMLIILRKETVLIEDGETVKEFKGDVQSILSDVLGIEVPIQSLRYWVLGVNNPSESFVMMSSGFQQSGWTVRIKELVPVKQAMLPSRMWVEKDKTKIKLVIDQWGDRERNE